MTAPGYSCPAWSGEWGCRGLARFLLKPPGLFIPNECRLLNDAAYAEARWAELQNQGDLAWDLDAITNRSEAIAFLKRFENRLCIYSAYVEKLYSNYSFVIPERALLQKS